jgi:[acyl-carrier-protein] S-malonyltransferase
MMSKTAVVFPGQGSQSLGMMSGFDPKYPIVKQLFEEASDILGYSLWELAEHGPLERMNQTTQTQVLMLTADVALYRILIQQGILQASMMAGHSLGEYAALVCADALPFEAALRLVHCRGTVMQEAMPSGAGAMAALVGLSDEEVQLLCQQASTVEEVVMPANYNAIGQVVVAGHTPAVQRLILMAESAGARLAKIIPVSVPCHCSLLTEAALHFEAHLLEAPFQKPSIPVVSNVDVSVYDSPTTIRAQLKKQLYSPVRWVETIQFFSTSGITSIVECGPGKVLTGLTKRIDKSISALSSYDLISTD